MIAFFGASVTIQKNSYAAKLASKFTHKVKIFGYGGMHLNNAGILFIDDILVLRPSFCFVDWFSTGYNEITPETIDFIDTIIHKFSVNQCKLIFLFFPAKSYYDGENDFHRFCKQHLEKQAICYLDLNYAIDRTEINAILRDDVHTTHYGSTLYANIIYEKFKKLEKEVVIPSETRPTKYEHVKTVTVERVFNKHVSLEGCCEIIAFELTIGPHSGVVDVDDGMTVKKYNTWDRWCYYPRRHFYLAMEIVGKTQLNILHEKFDTSNCNQKFDFIKIEKKLIIHNIYYIGESLKINNLHSGYRIKRMVLIWGKLRSRIIQYKNRINKQLLRI
jgi:hypothetical protein